MQHKRIATVAAANRRLDRFGLITEDFPELLALHHRGGQHTTSAHSG
ncbi:hypothetical protein LPW11_14710 [Geomonas sp. RF6]|nr:hypothetical protein [Geomonas sp. RF6]UFS69142.1 hypothetical protein LPW11_14710 [Geomonas sp. RF6]